MFQDMMEFVVTLVLIVAALIAVVVGSRMGYQNYIEKLACAEYGIVSKQATMYSLGTGCLVQRDGEWVDYSVATGKKQEITVKTK